MHLRDNHCWSARAELKIRCWPIRFELESPANRLRSRRLPPLPSAVVPAWELDCSCHVSRSFPEKFHQAAAARRVWPGGRLPLPHRERRLRLPSQTEPRRGRIAERAHHRAQSRSASDADYLTGRFGSLEPRRGFSPHRTAPHRAALGVPLAASPSSLKVRVQTRAVSQAVLGVAWEHAATLSGRPRVKPAPSPSPSSFPARGPSPLASVTIAIRGGRFFCPPGGALTKWLSAKLPEGRPRAFRKLGGGAIRQLW